MKAKAVVAVLLVAALGIGVWCVARPKPAPPMVANAPGTGAGAPLGTEQNPFPVAVASDELLQLRKPLADSVVFPGVKLGDSVERLMASLKERGIHFTGPDNVEGGNRSVRYDVSGETVGLGPYFKWELYHEARGAQIIRFYAWAEFIAESKATEFYKKLSTDAVQTLGHPGAPCKDDPQDCTYWFDAQNILVISYGGWAGKYSWNVRFHIEPLPRSMSQAKLSAHSSPGD